MLTVATALALLIAVWFTGLFGSLTWALSLSSTPVRLVKTASVALFTFTFCYLVCQADQFVNEVLTGSVLLELVILVLAKTLAAKSALSPTTSADSALSST